MFFVFETNEGVLICSFVGAWPSLHVIKQSQRVHEQSNKFVAQPKSLVDTDPTF